MTECLVYEHLRGGVVFYVGLGKPGRQTDKVNGRSHFHLGVWNSSEKEGTLEIRVVFRGSREECVVEEKRLIRLYGKRCDGTGTLTNFTDGGDGGNTVTPENREGRRRKTSESLRVLYEETDFREKVSNGMKNSQKVKDNCRTTLKDPEVRERHRRNVQKKEKFTQKELDEKYGSRNKGRHWWVTEDFTQEVLCHECPGPGWVRGRTPKGG